MKPRPSDAKYTNSRPRPGTPTRGAARRRVDEERQPQQDERDDRDEDHQHHEQPLADRDLGVQEAPLPVGDDVAERREVPEERPVVVDRGDVERVVGDDPVDLSSGSVIRSVTSPSSRTVPGGRG